MDTISYIIGFSTGLIFCISTYFYGRYTAFKCILKIIKKNIDDDKDG